MKTQKKLYHPAVLMAIATVVVLMVPFTAMQFTDEVKWSLPDFILMGMLIFSTGIAYLLISRRTSGMAYRAATALAIASGFLMIWANLAVGLIGSGPNLANLMYIGVLAIAVGGSVITRFNPVGMARTMYAAATAVLLLAVIALLAGAQYQNDGSLSEIIGINAFFATLFGVSGLLFHYASKDKGPSPIQK